MAKVKTYNPNDWQAQDDARHLMEAHKIKKDPKRHTAAKSAAKKMHDDALATLNAHRAVMTGK